MADYNNEKQISEMDVLLNIGQGGSIKINNNRIRTPIIDDFYQSEMTSAQIEKLSTSLGSIASGDGTAYYIEKPYSDKTGFYKEANVFIIKATPIIPGKGDSEIKRKGERAFNMNEYDGDTLYFDIESIADGDQPFTISNKTYTSLKNMIKASLPEDQILKGRFGLRFLGVNAPEIPHYSIVPSSTVTSSTFNISDITNDDKFVYDHSIFRDESNSKNVLFVKIDGKYYEVVDKDYVDDELINTLQEEGFDTSLEKSNSGAIESYEDFMKKEPKEELGSNLNISKIARPEKQNKINSEKYYKIVWTDSSENPEKAAIGLRAKEELTKLLSRAEDIVLMIDYNSINRAASNKYEDDFFASAFNVLLHPIKAIEELWNTFTESDVGFKYNGFNRYGQDAYKRFLGSLYVKVSVKDFSGNMTYWVNAAKYLIETIGEGYEILPSYTDSVISEYYNDFASNAFKLWSYNTQKAKIIDSLTEISKEDFDDRRAIQRQIVGMDFDTELKDWTVMIGDCLFMVPPTSIRCVTQTQNERLPLLRSRGSVVKGAPRSERLIELTLYFNNEDGINGTEFKTQTPNGKEITYYMNGLRSLIAMFKLTPFLPIENEYINKILEVEAVSLINLQISTMPGYPQCIAAVLILQEFNYQMYMPELPRPDLADESAYDINLFARTINYETMRWYYQRPLLKGNRLAPLDVSSKEYIDNTFGGHTALIPMKFESSDVEFYIPDKLYLDQLLNIKLEAMNKPLQTQAPITENAKKWGKELSYMFDKVNSLETNEFYKNAMASLEGTKEIPLANSSNIFYRHGNGKTESQIVINPTANTNKQKNTDKANNRINETTFVHYDLEKETVVNDQIVLLETLDLVYESILKHFNGYVKELVMEQTTFLNNPDHFGFIIKINPFISSEINEIEKDNLLKAIENELKLEVKDFYDKETSSIEILIKGKVTQHNSSQNMFADNIYNYLSGHFEIDKECAGYKFLQKVYYSYGIEKTDEDWATDGNDYSFSITSDEMQEIITRQKQSIDKEDENSFKFVKYPIENVKVTNLSAVFGNTMTKMSLKSMDGYAPQYSGGQDTVIEISMQTMDQEAVHMLKFLPKMAAQYMRDYKLILSCWPLRIDSEITKLLGVNEVLIESVDVTTVPNQPGLFDVAIRLMSVDRTARNKEALSRLDINNSGSKTNTTTNTYNTKDFFDFKQVISEAEIYPDLELPTLDELEYNGFKFIRYIRGEGYRKYPDPDFYFVYGHTLGNQVFRDTILHFINENSPKPEFRISDRYGASIDIRGAVIRDGINKGFEIIDKNETANLMNNQKDFIQKAVDNVISKKMKMDEKNKADEILSAEDFINIYSSLDGYQKWNVSDNIACIFREKKYEKLLSPEDKVAYDFILSVAESIDKIADDILNNPINEVKNNLKEKWNSKEFIESVNDKGNMEKKFLESLKKLKDNYLDRDNGDTRFAEIINYLGSYPSLQELKDSIPAYAKNPSSGGNRDPNAYTQMTIEKPIDIISLIIAAADAASGETEFLDDKDSYGWKFRMFTNAKSIIVNKATREPNDDNDYDLIPYSKVDVSSGGNVGIKLASSLKEAVSHGITFGPFQTRLYSKEEIKEIENNAVPKTDAKGLFLDPYYRNLQIQDENHPEVLEYKRCILMDPYISSIAFLRNTIYWIKKMVQDNVLISLYEAIQDQALKMINRQIATDTARANELEKEIKDQAKKDKKGKTKEEKKEYDAISNQLLKELESQIEDNTALVQDIKQALSTGREPFTKGKIFASIVMVLSSGSMNIYNLMKERNYDALNQIVRGAQLPNSGGEFYIIRKYVNALVGRGEIASSEKIGTSLTTASEIVGNVINEAVCLYASEDPRIYLRDSFYDMVASDKRGRMLRAFPTYYMIFIDEGREIGLWRLHDNFYNMSAIAEIQVTKSRKIAADTARIVMTNMFKTYTTDDEDSKEMGMDLETLENYQYRWKDVFNSIFSPRTYFLKEELARMNQLSTERAQLKPGVRIHLRMGYGSDASDLPVVFNGVVAEVGTGEAVEIICQGDGIELVNPILSTKDAEDIQNDDTFIVGRIFQNWLTKGATPRTILGSLLTTKGGWLNKTINGITNGRFFNQNPYGIVHFGDPMFTEVFQGSECLQNIYEAYHKPSWNESSVDDYLQPYFNTKDIPRLSAHIFGKSYWDVMKICEGAAPDFIASIAPFGIRSTIFYGSPHFYYAYDYERVSVSELTLISLKNELEDAERRIKEIVEYNPNSFWSNKEYMSLIKTKEEITERIKNFSHEVNEMTTVREKRKPFQQYHIYTSFSDIINNCIKTSSKDVRTCAVGLYQAQGAFGRENMKRVGPMWVDFDIYPEYQKTMTVDTQFLAKGVPVLGDIIPFLNGVINEVTDSNAYEVAWRITANELKKSIKDMYQGELTVIGDPSVKPYDKVWIEDLYEDMKGCFEVEAVVHNFSVENGFTTTIYPDCIATIDDRNEQVAHNVLNSVVFKGLAAYVGMVTLSLAFTQRSRPLLRMAAKWIDSGSKAGEKALAAIASFLGKDELIQHEKIVEKSNGLKKLLGINTAKYKYELYLAKAETWRDVIDSIDTDDLSTLQGLARYYEKVGDTLDSISPDALQKTLEEAFSNRVTQKNTIQKAIDGIEEAKKPLSDSTKNLVMFAKKADIGSEDYEAWTFLMQIAEEAKKTVEAGKGGEKLANAAEVFNDFLKAGGKLNDADAIKDFAAAMKIIATNVDDVDDFIDGTKVAVAAVKNLDNIKDAYKAADAVKETIEASKDIAKGAKLAIAGGKAALASTIIGIILEEVITTCLVGFAYEWAERWMRNLQVLQIWPLKKNGSVYTAGLSGSRGIIVGSPTENAQGPIDEWIANVFSWKTGPGSNMKNFMLSLFASEDMLEIAERYKKKNGIPTDDTSVTSITQITNDLMQRIASDEMVRQAGGYSSMLLVRRITDLGNRQEAEGAFNKYKVKDISTLSINQDVKENMIYLGFSNQLNEAKNRKHLKIMHDKVKDNTLKFELEGSVADVGIIRDIDSESGKEVADIPFVRPDLHYLICEIYNRLCNKLEYDSSYQTKVESSYSGLQYEDPVLQHQMIIHSALRAGDSTWHSTGFGCVIEIVDYDLESILIELQEEQLKEFGGNYFEYIALKANNKSKFKIMVHPPVEEYNS